ncbi:helix-turn-helix transcriptional regulator [Phytoactinopolyspora limicola]|uniref:helix-turn-helix transcriptional regulator n=1 Tax=Phytoactinopolyspora limicola TaxID=2715536 RepID=UPI001407C5A8|nr:LuxR family transcriptional regulator [Phytoactinopolyspora limicola]
MTEIENGVDVVGRDDELNLLGGLVEPLAAGSGGSIVVDGPPGIGKTAVLRAFVARVQAQPAPDDDTTPVSFTTASMDEQEWPYSGLHLVLSGISAVIDSHLHDALMTELRELSVGLGDHTSAHQVSMRLLSVFGQVSRPMYVVVDDAHRLDSSSQQVLGFVARRLGSVPVAMVFGADLSTKPVPFEALTSLYLGGLSEPGARTLLENAAGAPLPARVTRQIVAEVGGHPQALLDVVDRIPADQLTGRVELDVYLPDSPVVRRLCLPELDHLGEAERRVLLVAAASQDRRLAPLLDALREQDEAVVKWMIDHYLVSADGTFTFRRPAIASVMWRAATHSQQLWAHEALARAYRTSGDDQWLWHSAQTSPGVAEELAGALYAAAGASARAAKLEQARAWARQAVRLTPPGKRRAERLLFAGQLALLAGYFDEAVRLARERFSEPMTAQQRGDLALLEIRARQLVDGEVPSGVVTRHAEELAGTDPSRAAQLNLAAALGFARRLESAEAGRFLTLAQQAENVDTTTAGMLRYTEAAVASLRGEHDMSIKLIEGAEPLGDTFAEAERHLTHVTVLVRAGAYAEARQLLTGLVHDPILGASALVTGWAYAVRTLLEIRAGDMNAAGTAAKAWENAGATGLSNAVVPACMIRVHALLGETELAWAARRRALDRARRHGDSWVNALVAAETGALLLTLGRVGEAVATLGAARCYAVEHPDPAMFATEPDYIEACVRNGEHERAVAALEVFEERVIAVPTAWAHHTLARCAALVSAPEPSVPLFEEAITTPADGVSPVELARTMICLGERLRRLGHRIDAGRWLRQAMAVAESIGATALVAHAQEEIRATGQGPVVDVATISGLTRAERRVAALVAAGRRNREIAAELYVSVRTVETHLGRIYRKTGIGSRAELASLAAETAEPRR